jgi:hypothetical protein
MHQAINIYYARDCQRDAEPMHINKVHLPFRCHVDDRLTGHLQLCLEEPLSRTSVSLRILPWLDHVVVWNVCVVVGWCEDSSAWEDGMIWEVELETR